MKWGIPKCENSKYLDFLHPNKYNKLKSYSNITPVKMKKKTRTCVHKITITTKNIPCFTRTGLVFEFFDDGSAVSRKSLYLINLPQTFSIEFSK